MRVRWFFRAERSLAFIGHYIARDNPTAAYATLLRIKACGDSLRDFPERGRPGRIPGTRELIVAGTPYLIAYRIMDQEIQIFTYYMGCANGRSIFIK